MIILAYLLLTLSTPAQITPTFPSFIFSLPTAPFPTATPGPSSPIKALFELKQPPLGFVNCSEYGFHGKIESQLTDLQVVVWADKAGLVAVETPNPNEIYRIEIKLKASQPSSTSKFWVQLYQNDLAVSKPVLVEINHDCQHGYQIYQLNWQEVNP